jgi:cell division protein FtsW
MSFIIEKFLKEIEKLDRYIAFSFLILVVGGFIIFTSASLGILARSDLKFYNMLQSQLTGIALAVFLVISIAYFVPHAIYYKYAPYIYATTLFFTALVFVPALNLFHGGAHRWIVVGGVSIQPSEMLKFGIVIITSWMIKKYSKKFSDIKYGLGLFALIIIPAAAIMVKQPDNGTFLIIGGASFLVYFLGGARWRDISIIIITAIAGVSILMFTRPYVMDRLTTFMNPENDKLGSSYQTIQSLIAVGNGGMVGRGLGQSIQKFNYLPEPAGDSIFAVASEELGLFGSVTIISLFIIIAVRGLIIALQKKETFARSMIIGISAIFFIQMSLNVASMLGLMPLTGVPLPFISQGGTAILASTYLIGVLLQLTKKEI